MRRAVVRIIVGLVLTLPAPLAAQSGALQGTVSDSAGTPLANASVIV